MRIKGYDKFVEFIRTGRCSCPKVCLNRQDGVCFAYTPGELKGMVVESILKGIKETELTFRCKKIRTPNLKEE